MNENSVIQSKLDDISKFQNQQLLRYYSFHKCKLHSHLVVQYTDYIQLDRYLDSSSEELKPALVSSLLKQLVDLLAELKQHNIDLTYMAINDIFIKTDNDSIDVRLSPLNYVTNSRPSANYIAPELYKSIKPYSQSVIFSLGCIIFEIIQRKKLIMYEQYYEETVFSKNFQSKILINPSYKLSNTLDQMLRIQIDERSTLQQLKDQLNVNIHIRILIVACILVGVFVFIITLR